MFAHDTLIWISVSKYLESLFLALIEFMKFPYAPEFWGCGALDRRVWFGERDERSLRDYLDCQ